MSITYCKRGLTKIYSRKNLIGKERCDSEDQVLRTEHPLEGTVVLSKRVQKRGLPVESQKGSLLLRAQRCCPPGRLTQWATQHLRVVSGALRKRTLLAGVQRPGPRAEETLTPQAANAVRKQQEESTFSPPAQIPGCPASIHKAIHNHFVKHYFVNERLRADGDLFI